MSSKKKSKFEDLKTSKPFNCSLCGEDLVNRPVILDAFNGVVFCDFTCRDKFTLKLEMLCMEMEKDRNE